LTGAARRALEAVGDAWLNDGTYLFPRALLLAELDETDGNTDIARVEYAAALKEVRAMQAADPTDLRPMRAELWAQLGLGDLDGARKALRMNLQRAPRPYRWSIRLTWWTSALRAAPVLGDRSEGLALLKEATATPQGRLLLGNLFKVDPKMAALRADPVIRAMLEGRS
jgi:hypothetical protein